MKNNCCTLHSIYIFGTNLDPRTKLLAIVGLIAATFLTTSLSYLLGIAGLLTLFCLAAPPLMRRFLRNVLLLSWLLAITFAVNLWGGGWRDGVLTASQIVIVVGWVSLLSVSSSPMELVSGLEWLLHPLQLLGIPIHIFSVVTMLSLRFFPILLEEKDYLVHTYIARGIDLHKGNLIMRLNTYLLLCVPLVNSLLRRVEHLSDAMESRAFRAQTVRTSLYELHTQAKDYFILGGILVLLVFTRIVS